LIADEIAKGSTYRDIAKRFSEEWNVSPNYIRSMVSEAISLFQDENYYKSIKEINNERLNDIYKQARNQGDLDTAIKAIDKLNKANGVYD
jgi:uridine kinase